MKELTDTVIGSRKLKRVLMTINEKGLIAYCICFIDCQFPKSIFHFSKTLERKYEGCVVNRFDFPLDSINGKVFMANEFYFERTHLSEFEKKVFHTWRTNSADTNLPLSTY